MPSGDYKCLTCQEEEIQDRIVRVTPNSQRAREIREEDKLKVSRYNKAGYSLNNNKNAGMQLLKPRSYKFQDVL
jgi:hypothetical protein